MNEFENLVTLVYNVIISLISPIIQLPFAIIIQIYNMFDSMAVGILNSIEIYNNNQDPNNDEE